MNEFRKRADGTLLSESQLRLAFNGMAPAIVDRGFCDVLQVDPVLPAPAPEADLQHFAYRDGITQDALGNWIYAWSVRQRSPQEIEEEQHAATMSVERHYIGSLEEMLDRTAQERNYDNRLTCALRAAYSGPYQAEGQAFAIWMDACHAIVYDVLRQMKAGTLVPPPVDDLLGQLPELAWPD